MIKDVITYNGKDYQISTVEMYAKAYVYFETAIFPIRNGMATGHAIYTWKAYNADESYDKHRDILNRPEKYLSEESIIKYLESKEKDYETVRGIVRFPFQYMEQYFLGEISWDKAIEKTIDRVYELIDEYVEKHKLQEG